MRCIGFSPERGLGWQMSCCRLRAIGRLFMQPALRRDKETALQFFVGGPKLVRARRLRHGVRARVLDVETYRSLVREEISPVMNG